jgi:glycosyltransferase involved in cell wall biosynthesis
LPRQPVGDLIVNRVEPAFGQPDETKGKEIMRILIAGTATYPAQNGQAVFTENLTEGLAHHGHDVLSVFPSETGTAYSTNRNGVRIEALRSADLTRIHSDSYLSLFSESAIRRIFHDFQPEIVHIQDHFPVSYDVVQVARKFGMHLIGTNHFMPENIAGYVPLMSKFKPLFNWTAWTWMLGVYNRLDVATAQSKASASLMRAQGLKIPVYPVSCGIDLRRFHPNPQLNRKDVRLRYGIDPERTVFMFVGRVDKEKRLEVLLHALKLLNRDDVQLVIAGKGSNIEQLTALANELELGERVHFTGFIPAEDLPAVLNSADIFTMPSEAELLSIASLEAMASGLPVLLANAVALPELAHDGSNGYLFRPGDPADAARRMAQLADHPDRWARMGASSQEKAQFHSLGNTLRQYESLYTHLLAGTYAHLLESGINTLRSSPDWHSGNKK